MRNTMRKVTIVVPVLMTSCHVSLKWKIGPVAIQAMITRTAMPKVPGWPVARAIPLARRAKKPAGYGYPPLRRGPRVCQTIRQGERLGHRPSIGDALPDDIERRAVRRRGQDEGIAHAHP